MSKNLFLHQCLVNCGDDGVWPMPDITIDTVTVNTTDLVAGVAGAVGNTKTLFDVWTRLSSPAQSGEAAAAATPRGNAIAGAAGNTKTRFDVWTRLASPAQAGEAAAAAAAPTTITAGTKSVTAHGTPEKLVAAVTNCRAVTLKPKSNNDGTANNTSVILVGGSNTTALFRVTPNSVPLTIPISDASKIWVDSIVNGEGVEFLILA
jgi:hypothetical protein